MAKFKEWFYKKISEDSFTPPSGASIVNQIGSLFNAQKPTTPPPNPNAVATQIAKVPTLAAALSLQPQIAGAVAQRQAKKALNPSSTATNAQGPGTTIQPGIMQPPMGPLSTNFV